MSDKQVQRLKELSRKELKSLAKTYDIEVNDEMKKSELRKLIKAAEKDGMVPVKSKEQLIIDFIKSMVALDESILPFKEQRKDLKKQYKENKWLDAKEQKSALQALRLLRGGESIEILVKYYNEIQEKTGIGEE